MKHLIFPVILLSACVIAFTCSSSDTKTGSANLEGTKWILYEMEDVEFTVPSGGKTVFIKFEEKEKKASGSASCNSYFSTYTAVKTADGKDNVQLSLKFGPVGSTKIYCDYMDTETKYFAALEKTTQYKISGQKLYLYNNADKVILRFKAE